MQERWSGRDGADEEPERGWEDRTEGRSGWLGRDRGTPWGGDAPVDDSRASGFAADGRAGSSDDRSERDRSSLLDRRLGNPRPSGETIQVRYGAPAAPDRTGKAQGGWDRSMAFPAGSSGQAGFGFRRAVEPSTRSWGNAAGADDVDAAGGAASQPSQMGPFARMASGYDEEDARPPESSWHAPTAPAPSPERPASQPADPEAGHWSRLVRSSAGRGTDDSSRAPSFHASAPTSDEHANDWEFDDEPADHRRAPRAPTPPPLRLPEDERDLPASLRGRVEDDAATPPRRAPGQGAPWLRQATPPSDAATGAPARSAADRRPDGPLSAPTPASGREGRLAAARPHPAAPARDTIRRPPVAPPVAAPSDPLLETVDRAVSLGRALPVTLIAGVPARPGVLGPLFTSLATRMKARRPFGIQDRLVSQTGMIAGIADASAQQDFDTALRYLHHVVFPENPDDINTTVLLPLWNVDITDQRSWAIFRSLSALVTLSVMRRRPALYLLATAPESRTASLTEHFDSVIPLDSLAPNAHEPEVKAALIAALKGDEAPRERDLRMQLPVVTVRRQQDELRLDVRAPDPEAGGGLLGRFGSKVKARDDEMLASFGRKALVTIFAWDPSLQYVELTLLREDRGLRRVVLELKTTRAGLGAQAEAA